MDLKVCLDTDAVIAIFNNEERAAALIDKIKDCKVFITTITLFEMLLRETNIDQIETFRSKVEVLGFDEPAAREASLISKNLKKLGRLMDFRDIFIAAICLINDCSLATFNRKHFDSIKYLNLLF